MPADTLALRYDRVAPTWDSKLTRLGYHSAYDHLFNSTRPESRVDQVLDAGCGSGAFAAALARATSVGSVDLLDNSCAMRTDAKARLAQQGVDVRAEFSALFANGVPTNYDVVLAGHLIEHTPNPEMTFSWLASRLLPGGTLYLAVSRPHWCTAIIRLIWGHRAFDPSEVLNWGESAGLAGRAIPFPYGPPRRTSMGYVFRRGESRSPVRQVRAKTQNR